MWQQPNTNELCVKMLKAVITLKTGAGHVDSRYVRSYSSIGLYLSPLLAFNFLPVDSSSGRLILGGVHLATSSYHLCEERAPFPRQLQGSTRINFHCFVVS